MTITERASRSVNNVRILFDLDITQLNSQWVNAGVGVWYVNSNAVYAAVDSSLLNGFTAQGFVNVGSVLVDSAQLYEASTLLECSSNEDSFYWEGLSLYIHLLGGDSPYIHTISIGVVFGYSREGFTPVGAMQNYDSRLIGVPSISKSRDPLFYGKLQFEGGNVDLNNGDGFFDQLGEDNNAYGNQTRISMGFEGMDYADYARLFTGFVETLDIGEDTASISFADRRKQLTKPIIYTCTNKNALDAIEEILLDEYSIPYNTLYFNTALWAAAKAKAYNVTINMQTAESAIDTIQKICESTFGIFQIDNDGKYAFRIIRPGDAATFSIPQADIINATRAKYDPSEIISSTKIGYAKDWTLGESSAYTYLTDTSKEASIYLKYKTYNQRQFDTMLPNLAAAQQFSDTILDYSGTIRPTLEIEVPIKYFDIDVGDFAEIEINRPHATWFGERKCEVVRKVFNLDRNTITLTVRKYGGELFGRVTTDGYIRKTTDDSVRRVGA